MWKATPYRVRYGDIYVYAAISGVIGLWTLVYGLYFTLKVKCFDARKEINIKHLLRDLL